MNAILMAVVRFVETVVHYSFGAVLVALTIIGLIAACRWLLAHSDTGGSFGRALRRGSGSLVLAAVLAVGLVCLLGGVALWTR